MKKPSLLLLLMITLSLVINGCAKNEQGNEKMNEKQGVELTISAATSLQNSLNEIKTSFEKEHPGVKIIYNFGASGSLQLQITQGAPVDLFLSAAEEDFDQLVAAGIIEKQNSIDLIGNEIVLVVPKNSDNKIKTFEDLMEAKKIAVGTPETVPAGKYAKETLEALNVWNLIEGKLVFAKDVRQVLTYVETNNVDAGIVYKTDALQSTKVKTVATAKEGIHSPIIYPLGMIKDTTHPKEAKLYYDYLQTSEARRIFKKYGFNVLIDK